MAKTREIAMNEIRLDTPHGTLAGLRWRTPQDVTAAVPVLCLHGWLDNAASFIPLSRYLHGFDLVAIDLPGHGQSFHRHASAPYYFTEYLHDVDDALDALGWSSCHLLGHSMGAAVASLYAAACPEKVRSVILLDAPGPSSEKAGESSSRLRRSMHHARSGPRFRKSYDSLEDMVRVRKEKTALAEQAARLICERSAKQVNDHYEWTNDPALYWVSPVLMHEDQAKNFMASIEASVLTMTATPYAPFLNEQMVKERCAAIPNGKHLQLDGGHHFHMDQPEAVATTIESFLIEQDQQHELTHAPS